MTRTPGTAAALDAPVARSERIAWLDVLRGVAILGILPVNAAYFAYPMLLADSADYPGAPGDHIVTWIVRALFEYKLITLFAFLFGVGIGLQARRAAATGREYRGALARRTLLLILMGVLHATLLWPGDILFMYGVLGLALLWFAGARADALGIVGGLGLLGTIGVVALFAVLAAVAPSHFDDWFEPQHLDGVGAEAATGSWRAFLSAAPRLDPDFELAVIRDGTYARAVAMRAAGWGSMLVFGFVAFGARLGGLVLLGMAAVRDGAWLREGEGRGRRMHRFGLAVLLPAGLTLEILAATWSLAQTEPGVVVTAELLHQIGSLAMAAGLASLVALVISRLSWSRPLAAVGRTALSCYIGQTVVMTAVFHGFGLYARIDRTELAGVVLGVWALELVAATLWLRWFAIGPLEWLWRAATYLHLPPLRRRAG